MKKINVTNIRLFFSNCDVFVKIISPHRSFMDDNRLYWIFVVSFYKITKIVDYNRLKMDYKDNIF